MQSASNAYSIVLISGLRRSERRGIVLLASKSGRLNAQTGFERIDTGKSLKNRSRELRGKFDWWIEDRPPQNNWYHGWDKEEYRHCFCFKLNIKNVMHRFYGFICHPQPNTRPRFQLCVLCFFDAKADGETDKYYLREMMRLFADTSVINAVRIHFPDTKENDPCVH